MKFKQEFKVRSYDTDKDAELLPSRLIDYMIETSVVQSDTLLEKYDVELDFYWVILRWEVERSEKIYYGDELEVYTFTTGLYKFYAYRDWEVVRDGEIIARGKSQWLGLSKDNLRPVRLSDDLNRLYEKEEGYDKLERKFSIPEGKNETLSHFNIRKADIDINQHVNNARYIDWLTESFDRKIKDISIYYKHQILYGEEVEVKGRVEGDLGIFEMFGDDGTLRAYGTVTF